MGHKSGTHPEDIPLTKGVIIIKGIYYLRVRVPTDLVHTPPYSGKKFIKKSLRTREPREANAKATILLGNIEQLHEDLRRQVAKADRDYSSNVANFAISGTQLMNPTREVSQQIIEQIFVEEFRRLEKLTEIEISKRVTYSPEERELIALNLQEDLAAIMGGEYDFELRSSRLLQRHHIDAKRIEPSHVEYLAALLQETEIELTSRKLQQYTNHRYTVNQRLFDLALRVESQAVHVAKEYGVTLSLGDLCSEYIENQKRSDVTLKTLQDAVGAVACLLVIVERSTPLTEVSSKKAREVIEFIATLPKGIKVGEDVSAYRACVERKKRTSHQTVSGATYDKKLMYLVSLFEFALKEHPDALKLNPFTIPSVATYRKTMRPIEGDRPAVEFTVEELNTLFQLPLYTGHKAGLRGWNKRGTELEKRSGRFWAPLLLLYHGCRLNEAAQLLVSDIVVHEGISCLWISEKSYKGDPTPKQLKNKDSERLVPIHSELIKMGFLSFLQRRKKERGAWLFPEWAPDALKAWSIGQDIPPVSKKHSDRASDHGLKLIQQVIDKGRQDRPNNHSFRHMVRTALRRAEVSTELAEAIQGWSNVEGGKKGTQAHYGTMPIEKLKEAVDKISYEGLKVSHLYD